MIQLDNVFQHIVNLLFSTFQYKIPKKEEVVEQQQAEPDNPLMRKKKTPEELAAEAELEDQDEFTSKSIVLGRKSIIVEYIGVLY